jgi:4-hydroxy-3-polyprenylbenzoate decarboxylase
MKIVVGITGASGAIYARQLIESLQGASDCEVAIMASANGEKILQEETGKSLKDFGFRVYGPRDFSAPFVSGSSVYDAMVVVPCSLGTLGRIATGTSSDTMTRAADVFLKERKKLILVPRETPLSLIHLDNMRTVTMAGGVILPAMPSFYSGPRDIEALAATVTSRILDHLGVPNSLMKRWMEKA